MKYSLQKNNKKNLLIFFTGALSLPNHFAHLKSKLFDVFMIYEYLSFDFDKELLKSFEKYEKIYLIAHSMGVMIAYKQGLKADVKIAINGSIKGIDKLYGINPRIFKASYKNFDLEYFKKALFKEHLKKARNFSFPSNPSLELKKIYEYYENQEKKEYIENDYYDFVIASENDEIFPQRALLKSFLNTKIYKIKQPHFIFFGYEYWDEILHV